MTYTFRFQHDEAAPLVERTVDTSLPVPEQMEVLGMRDEVKFAVPKTAQDVLVYALCHVDSRQGGYAEVLDAKGVVSYAHPVSRAEELQCGSCCLDFTPRREKVAA
jgi:hypothetical protein